MSKKNDEVAIQSSSNLMNYICIVVLAPALSIRFDFFSILNIYPITNSF